MNIQKQYLKSNMSSTNNSGRLNFPVKGSSDQTPNISQSQKQQRIPKQRINDVAISSNTVLNKTTEVEKLRIVLSDKDMIDYIKLWDILLALYQQNNQLSFIEKQSIVTVLFETQFCSDTFNKFEGNENYQEQTAFDLIQNHYTQQNLNLIQPQKEGLQKHVFQACYDLALSLIIKLFQGDKENKENLRVNFFDKDLALHVLNQFISHQRRHLHKSQTACFISLHALSILFDTLGDSLYKVAKERELINFLFNTLPSLFKQETQQQNQVSVALNNAKLFNLNSIISGNQINQGIEQQLPLETQLSQQARQFSNNQIPPVSAKNKKDHQQSSKINKEERKIGREKSGTSSSFMKKLSFNNRAISEPPSGSKNNAVMPMPVTEDQNDENQSSSEGGEYISRNMKRRLEQVEEEDLQRMSNGKQQEQRKPNSNRGAQVKAVPPLPMNQIQQMQQQIQTPTYNVQTAHLLQPHTTINSSSLIMTSYLNMPLGMFSTTLNHLSSNSRHPTGPAQHFSQPNYKLTFVPQTTLAKSRLTRRQISMSRKNTHKFSSVSNITQGPYGNPTHEDGMTPNIGSIRQYQNQEFSNERRNDYSTSQTRKGPTVPKLNINQINAYDPTNQHQRMEMTASAHPLNQTSQGLTLNGGGQLTTTQNILKSSNRSNVYSNQNFENHIVLANSRLSNNPINLVNNPYQMIMKYHKKGDESEHKNSLYEDVNGSFNEDMAFVDAAGQTVIGGGDFNFENAEEKLKQLAIQLGEACLTNDLAALISQKRDLQLVKTARKTANSMLSNSKQQSKSAMSKSGVYRSVSMNYSNEPYFNHKNDYKGSFVSQFEHKEARSNQMQTRLLVMHMAYKILKCYDMSETRFLKQPLSSLNSYICSERFHNLTKQKIVNAMEEGSCDFMSQTLRKYQAHTLKKRSIKGLLKIDTSIDTIDSKQLQIMNKTNIISSIYQSDQPLFRVKVCPEDEIVFKIYQKFTFVNEDIIRTQVSNELANFSSRERGLFGGALMYESILHSDSQIQNSAVQQNQVPNLNLAPLGLVGTQKINRQGSHQILHINPQSSGDDSSSRSSFLSTLQEASTSISNPNIIWSSHGIGFDLSSSTSNSTKSNVQTIIQKERLRKKLDVFLYNIDRRIKSHISSQFQQYSSLEKISYQFAKNLRSELFALNAYLESQKSRIMLYQIIEVILESLLTIKKCLTDLPVKTNIFVMDFSKNYQGSSITPETGNLGTRSVSGVVYSQVRSPNSFNHKHQQKVAMMIKNQKEYRKLFSEYLRLISILLQMIPDSHSINNQNIESMKLLNEIFISGDDQWQESVKTYVISLFFTDIASTIDLSKAIQNLGNEVGQDFLIKQMAIIIDELRGINLVNFEEESFLSQFTKSSATSMIPLNANIGLIQVKKSLYFMLNCAQNCLLYFQSVMSFYHKAIQQHFNHKYGNQKGKQTNSVGVNQKNQEEILKEKNDAKNSNLNDAKRNGDQQSSINVVNNQEENSAISQKYWKQAIRKILYQILYLITPPNGLLSSYMQTNAINFINLGVGSATSRMNQTSRASVSPMRPTPPLQNFGTFVIPEGDQIAVLRYGSCPLNFQITLSTLNFLRLVFTLPENFTKYAFLHEELMLFYIRTHYISYVRLYNNNFAKNTKKNGAPELLNEGSKYRSMTLCKEHLECLFAIARNRNEDTRRKLYQFKIVQFLCQEIELEFECTTAANKQKRVRLMKEANDAAQNNGSLREKSSKRGEVRQEELKAEEKIPEVKENKEISQQVPIAVGPKKLGFGIPKLNITGLGLSEIVPSNNENNRTQIEIDQLRLLAEEQKKKAEKAKSSRRSSNSHRLIHPDAMKPKIIEAKALEPSNKDVLLNNNGGTTPMKKGLPFSIPKLNVSGLGLSEIIPGTGDPKPAQEIKNDENQQQAIQQPKKQMGFSIPKLNVAGLGLSEIVPGTAGDPLPPTEQLPQVQPQIVAPKKPIGFSIPKLNVAGLGLSEIIEPAKQEQELVPQTQDILMNPIKEEQKFFISDSSSDEFDPSEMVTQPEPQQQKKSLGFSIPKLNVEGLGLSDLIKPEQNEQQKTTLQPPENMVPQQQPQPIKKGFVIPKLKVEGLGLSEIVPGTGDPQPNPQIKEEQIVPQSKKPMGFSIPKLNVAGLGLSEIIPGTGGPSIVQQPKEVKQTAEPVNINPVLKKPMGFSIPKLNVAGLGLSEIIPGTGDPQPQKEQNVDDVQPSVQQQKKAIGFSIPKLNVAGLGLSDLKPDTPKQDKKEEPHFEERKQQQNNLQIKTVKFGIPKLNITGLGLSDIVPDPPQNPDLVTMNPNMTNLQTVNQTIDYASGSIDPSNLINKGNVQTTTNQNDMLFQQRQSERRGIFENTAPVKIYDDGENYQLGGIGASAPQDNRKSKKPLIMPQTRNDMSVKESLESAQFIHFASKLQPSQLNNEDQEESRLFDKQDSHKQNQLRVSHNSQMRLESIMDGQLSNFSGSMVPSPMPEVSKGNNYQQSAQILLPVQLDSVFGSPDNLHMPMGSHENLNVPGVQKTSFFPSSEKQSLLIPILKKPGVVIPLIKIPEKIEQESGITKMQQQIEYSQQNEKTGDLTQLQKELTKNNVKFQVLMEHQKSQKNFLPLEPETSNSINQQEDANLYEDVEAFYLKERSMRPIYQDEELHILMISLLVCLLLTPERGTLDDLYCSQFPIDNGKQNILFLLHHHINHPKNANSTLIYKVMSRVHKEVSPPLAGVRLIKLLSAQLFDLGMYNNGKNWSKIAEGAYSQVYESKTNLAEPSVVAIKELFIPKSIYDRCVLHDIFTEITCLEELRLEPCVSDLYDYGLSGGSYYIIMKRYTCSLRQWRLNQTKSLNENLSLYLSIYKEFLKSLMTVHSHNVTHYDIKCDNVLLDFNTDGSGQSSLSSQFLSIGDNEDDKIKLTIGDFGECKVFSNEKDEFCQRNRGTDFCKSPEMLQLTINTRKDTEKYDRRKQVGTNRLSDVWSAGCLLYELLTGEYLFYTPDYLQFHFRVTRPSEALFTQERLDKINNNVYLIDFMKYMLVRDLRLRPSIENVLKRFEHVHALLVSTTGGGMHIGLSNMRMGMIEGNNHRSSASMTNGGSQFEANIEQVMQIMKIPQSQMQLTNENDPYYIRIMDDISLCNLSWFKKHNDLKTASGQYLVNQNITHLIVTADFARLSNVSQIRDQYEILEVPNELTYKDGTTTQRATAFNVQPILLDYLRSVALKRSRVLFVESDTSADVIRESILLALAHIYQTSAYETYTVVRSQNLQFRLFDENEGHRLQMISQFTQLNSKISNYLATYPRFQCKCGSCTIVLKRQYANYNNMETISCTCSHYYRNVETSVCPSPGCTDFLSFLKTHFKSQPSDNLQWGFFELEDVQEQPMILGPRNYGSVYPQKSGKKVASQNNIGEMQRQIADGMSEGIDANCELVSIIEKKNTANVMGGGHRKGEANNAGAGNQNGASVTKWMLYKCKQCHVWTHAFNEAESRFSLLLNNRVKPKNHFVNIRTLTAKQTAEGNNSASTNVRVPILQKIKLSLPF